MSQFDIRLVAFTPGAERLGPVDALSIDATLAFSDAASFTAKLSDLTMSSLPAIVEIAIEYWNPALNEWVEPDDARFLAKGDESDDKDPSGMRTMTGVGLIPWMLSKNVIAVGAGGPDPAYPDGHRPFVDALPGAIVKTFLDEAKARGWGSFIDFDFTHNADSEGVPWAEAYTIAYKPGITAWLALSNLADQAIVEFSSTGRTLHLYRADHGTDRSLGNAPVRIGHAAENMPIKTSIDHLITHATVFGENGAVWEFTEGATNILGRLEGSIQQGGVSRPGTAAKMASSTLQGGRQVKRQITATENSLTTPSLPFIDYLAGDWVLARVADADESLRVMEIQLRKGESITIDTVLNDRFIDLLARTAKRANGILGGSNAGGTGVPPIYDQRRIPKPPIGVLASSEGYWTEDGEPRSSLAVRWVAVTQGTDDVDIHNPSYELWWRKPEEAETESKLLGSVIAGSFGSNGYEPGTQYLIKVRAVSEHDVKGVYAAEVPVTMAAPNTPLDPPTAPILSCHLGVVTVQWDGMLTSGGTIFEVPPQFRHVYVTISESEGGPYTTTGQTLERADAKAVVAGLPMESAQWFQMHAEDSRGVSSAASIPSMITVKGLTLTDVEGEIADAIAGAQSTATVAQYSADGKTQIIYSEDDPSGFGENPGDTWFRRAGGGLITAQWEWAGDGGANLSVSSTIVDGVLITNVVPNPSVEMASGSTIDPSGATRAAVAGFVRGGDTFGWQSLDGALRGNSAVAMAWPVSGFGVEPFGSEEYPV